MICKITNFFCEFFSTKKNRKIRQILIMKKIREIRILDLSFWPNLSYFFRIFVITMKVTEHYQTSLRGRR